MTNDDILLLRAIQEHGDLAFLQGFKAAKAGIPLEDRIALSRMNEAIKRLRAFVKIAEAIK